MNISMEVVGVRVEMPSNQPIILLKEVDGQRFLPIWVGSSEATAIAFVQQGVKAPRPMTHDLMADVIEALDAVLTNVVITRIEEGVFFAELNCRTSAGVVVTISARPSDAIALALRTHSNILADAELVDEVGISIPAEAGEENQEGERFRQFLDEINPEDFAG